MKSHFDSFKNTKILVKFRRFAQITPNSLSLLMKKVENAIKQGKNEKNLANKCLVWYYIQARV